MHPDPTLLVDLRWAVVSLGLRRIAWGGGLLALAPLAFTFFLVPLWLGCGLLAAGAWSASRRVEAFRPAVVAAALFAALAALMVPLVSSLPFHWVTDAVFALAALAAGVTFASVGEGMVRLDGRRWSALARLAGWTTVLGAASAAGTVLSDAYWGVPEAWEDLLYGGTMMLGAASVLASVLAWQVVAHRRPVEVEAAMPGLPPTGGAGPHEGPEVA